MQKMKRTVNRNYIWSLLKLKGMTFKTLGESLIPPVTVSAVSRLLSLTDEYKDETRIKQVADILNVADIFLFPFMPIGNEGIDEKEII